MVKEVKNLTNIKLTESDTDGIWLHFEAKGLKVGVSLDILATRQFSGIAAATIQNWAREQLDKQEISAQECYEKAKSIKHANYEVLLMILQILAKLEIKIKQMDRQETPELLSLAPSNEFLSGTRPSLSVDGGY